MMRANSFKSDKQSFKLVLPSEYTLDCMKPFLENLFIEQSLATSFCFLAIAIIWGDIWLHPCIINLLSISSTIVYSIKTHDASR